MNIDRVYNKVVASFATGIRGDLVIADFQKLDSISAHMLMEYSSKLGRPSGDDIERYFAKTFEGKIIPIMASCAIKPQSISIVARLNVPVRAIEDSQDKAKMTPIIAGMMYLDNQLGDHWEVKEEEDGKKILSKTSKDNIEQIIANRRNRMFITQTPNVSLASVAVAREFLGKGDIVKAYHKGHVIPLEILECVKGGFKVKAQTGKEMTIAKEQVLDLMQQQYADMKNESAKLVQYFTEAFGDKKYASELVKNYSK
jgi:hypothetical protein